MKDEFLGRVVLVTGASRGIGRAIALELASRGASVAATYLSKKSQWVELESELRGTSSRHLLVPADVGNYRQVDSMMRQVHKRLGKIHFLILNAGISRGSLIRRMKLAEWNEVIETNLSGAFHCAKSALNHMVLKEGSRIILISSILGETGGVGQVNYSAAKAGLIGMTKSLARELAPDRVTVNAVAPGFTDTDMFRALSPRIQKKVIRFIPLGRLARPEEIAGVVRFLCSEGAGYITGTVIHVNGGVFM